MCYLVYCREIKTKQWEQQELKLFRVQILGRIYLLHYWAGVGCGDRTEMGFGFSLGGDHGPCVLHTFNSDLTHIHWQLLQFEDPLHERKMTPVLVYHDMLKKTYPSLLSIIIISAPCGEWDHVLQFQNPFLHAKSIGGSWPQDPRTVIGPWVLYIRGLHIWLIQIWKIRPALIILGIFFTMVLGWWKCEQSNPRCGLYDVEKCQSVTVSWSHFQKKKNWMVHT